MSYLDFYGDLIVYFYYLYGDPKEKFKKQEIKKNRKRKNNKIGRAHV